MEKLKKLSPLDENSPVSDVPYRQAIGSLMYLMIGTRPGIAFSIRKLSQFSAQAMKHHWITVKRVLRYINGTKSHAITYGSQTSKLKHSTYGIRRRK